MSPIRTPRDGPTGSNGFELGRPISVRCFDLFSHTWAPYPRGFTEHVSGSEPGDRTKHTRWTGRRGAFFPRERPSVRSSMPESHTSRTPRGTPRGTPCALPRLSLPMQVPDRCVLGSFCRPLKGQHLLAREYHSTPAEPVG